MNNIWFLKKGKTIVSMLTPTVFYNEPDAETLYEFDENRPRVHSDSSSVSVVNSDSDEYTNTDEDISGDEDSIDANDGSKERKFCEDVGYNSEDVETSVENTEENIDTEDYDLRKS